MVKWRLALSLVRLRPFETDTDQGRSDERYRRIALTTLSTVAVRGLGTIVGLVTVPLVLAHLGKDRYGLWATITTVVAWVTLFDFGIANGLVNCLSRAHGRDDREEAAQFVSTALAILFGVAVVLAAIVAFAAPLVPWSSVLAARGAVDERTARRAVVAALGMFVVGLPLSIVPQVYAGYQRTYVANAFSLVGVVAGFIGLLLALRWGAGIPILVVVFGLGTLVASLLGFAYVRFSTPWLLRASAVSRDAAGSLMSRSMPLFLFQLGALAVNETQFIVLAHRCDLGTVAEYSILIRLYVLAIGLVQVSTTSFVPSFREAHDRGDRAWVRAAFRQFVRARMLLAAVAATALLVAGNPVLRLWLRRSDITFRPEVWVAVAVLMLATTWVTAHSDLLSIMDRAWSLVGLVLINGVVTVGLTYWLAPTFKILGIVVASAAVVVPVFSWLIPWRARALLAEPR